MNKPDVSARRVAPGKGPLFDDAAVARAEQALQSMSGHFQEWLEAEVLKLHEARNAARDGGWSDASLDDLLIAAHDLKGLGATYAYPLTTAIAASLCRLIDTREAKSAARAAPALIDAHVDAVRAAARDRVKTEADPIGQALLAALVARVDALGLAPV